MACLARRQRGAVTATAFGAPVPDELTPAQIAELRVDLVSLRQELESLLQATDAGVKPVDLDEPIGRTLFCKAVALRVIRASSA